MFNKKTKLIKVKKKNKIKLIFILLTNETPSIMLSLINNLYSNLKRVKDYFFIKILPQFCKNCNSAKTAMLPMHTTHRRE